MSLQYRSYADLVAGARALAVGPLVNSDVVIGIPRSGLIPAAVIALELNVPLQVLHADGLSSLDMSVRRPGPRGRSSPKRVALVDDSANLGTSMASAIQPVASAYPGCEIQRVAVFVSDEGRHHVDNFHEIVAMPRAFQWNLFHHQRSAEWAYDIDGLLCSDPPMDELQHPEEYAAFVSSVMPLIPPGTTLGTLITSRVEALRSVTEAWLSSHQIVYRRLIMFPGSPHDRRSYGAASFKADILDRYPHELFVESDPRQADIIRGRGHSVVCLDISTVSASHKRVSRVGRVRFLRRAVRLAKRLTRTPQQLPRV